MIEYILTAGLLIFAILYIREIVKRKNLESTIQQLVKEARVDAVKRSRAVIEGETFERLVTHFKEWTYGNPSEARFISSPLDYVVFRGLSEDDVKEIIFVEVKTRNSQTTKRQKSVRNAIKNGKVRYELLKIKDER